MRDRAGNPISQGDRVAFPTSVLGAIGDGLVTKIGSTIMSPGHVGAQVPTEQIEITMVIRLDVPVGAGLREMVVVKPPMSGVLN